VPRSASTEIPGPGSREPDERAPLSATPALERLLARLRARLTRQVWFYGLGTLLGALSLWLTFAFFADWALRVPRGVRVLHLLVLVALPVWIAWRFLVRPLRRRPDRAGLAILIERARPGLHELLVSAVQLQGAPRSGADPELLRDVCERAESEAARMQLSGVLDERPPALRFAVGGTLAFAGVLLLLSQGPLSAIFLERLFGGTTAWPQRTQLFVSVPLATERAQVLASAERILVRAARGTDVPVAVRAEGVVPDEVKLHFDDGGVLLLSPSADGVFRTLLRSCQEDLAFHATGGDDDDGEPRVQVEVLEPPDVAGLAVSIAPPEYTGRPPRTEFDHDVEVLAGSQLSIVMLPRPPEATGQVRVLPADAQLELKPMPFPLRSDAGADPSTGASEAMGLGFELEARESVRLRFELTDSSGLENPDPGLFAIHVVEDRRPEVEMFAPGRTEVDTVVGGVLALRARATDDFGVRSMSWASRPATEGEQARAFHELQMRPAQPIPGKNEDAAGVSVIAGTRIDVAQLGTEASPAGDGSQYLLEIVAQDNRPSADPTPAASAASGATENVTGAPDAAGPGVGRSSTVRVHVVSVDEFLRRVQDRLARVRLSVTELEELQRQKASRTRELLESLESDSPALGSSGSELSSVLAGQRRVEGDVDALARELASITEGVLYARLDDKAGAALEQIDAALASAVDRSFQAQAWRELALSWRQGKLGTQGLAGQLVGLLDLGLQIGLEDSRPATQALDRAAQAVDVADIHAALVEASGHQARALAHIDELLGRLAEWDNFQSILSLTRDILNRQKALMERTKQTAKEK
jgi:hypothetical protein